MAAMGKVLMRERAEVVSVLSAAFPILTFLFRLIDFSGTMKKVRPHSPFCTWKIMRSDGGGAAQKTPRWAWLLKCRVLRSGLRRPRGGDSWPC